MIPEALPQRPDLEKKPVVLATIAGVGLGALICGGLEALFSFPEDRFFPGESLLRASAKSAAIGGAIMGTVSLIATQVSNAEKGQVKPYVERLERELLAKNVAPDNSQQR